MQKIAEVLNVSIDTLVFGQKNAEDDINDKELATLFKKYSICLINKKKPLKTLLLHLSFKKIFKNSFLKTLQQHYKTTKATLLWLFVFILCYEVRRPSRACN
ncbi:hypothetical protein FLAVO9AF_120044 [Flavobacterium sp. 9AF]|nr:hypothetical protein FLAVO9AF_120044 [Flavobacterium sp. 9AF]